MWKLYNLDKVMNVESHPVGRGFYRKFGVYNQVCLRRNWCNTDILQFVSKFMYRNVVSAELSIGGRG